MLNELNNLAAERTDDSLIGAERSTIGAMLLDGRVVTELKGIVRPGDFFDPRYEVICETIYDLHSKGRPIDVITVGTRMRVKGKFTPNLSEAHLHELAGEVPTSANAAYYAEIVVGGATRRRLRNAGLKLIEAADNPAVNVMESVETGRTLLDDAIPGNTSLTTVAASLDDYEQSLTQETTYTRTPWPDLDALITGWKPGRLVVVGARPAVGKSLIGVQIAEVMAMHGSVVYFSAEMDEREILTRMYASIGGIRINGLESHNLSDDEKRRMAEARKIIEKLNMYVDDQAQTWDHIEQTTWEVHRKGNLKMIVVDYLGLYRDGAGRHESRQVELETITRRAKMLAKRLGITVVMLAQLNRDAEKTGGEKPPTMAHLRGTGSLEQDADLVVLLHQGQRKNAVTKQFEKDGTLSLIIAKQRNGPTGTVDLQFEGVYARANHKIHG